MTIDCLGLTLNGLDRLGSAWLGLACLGKTWLGLYCVVLCCFGLSYFSFCLLSSTVCRLQKGKNIFRLFFTPKFSSFFRENALSRRSLRLKCNQFAIAIKIYLFAPLNLLPVMHIYCSVFLKRIAPILSQQEFIQMSNEMENNAINTVQMYSNVNICWCEPQYRLFSVVNPK